MLVFSLDVSSLDFFHVSRTIKKEQTPLTCQALKRFIRHRPMQSEIEMAHTTGGLRLTESNANGNNDDSLYALLCAEGF